VVIDYVHDHANALLVEIVDHPLNFENAVRIIGWSLRVVGRRNVVVQRIVSQLKQLFSAVVLMQSLKSKESMI